MIHWGETDEAPDGERDLPEIDETGELVLVGRIAFWSVQADKRLRPVRVKVRLVNERLAYGRHEYLVEPVAGEGRTWVTAEKLFVS